MICKKPYTIFIVGHTITLEVTNISTMKVHCIQCQHARLNTSENYIISEINLPFLNLVHCHKEQGWFVSSSTIVQLDKASCAGMESNSRSCRKCYTQLALYLSTQDCRSQVTGYKACLCYLQYHCEKKNFILSYLCPMCYELLY